MPVFLLFVTYLVAALGLAALLAPSLQPWLFGPLGLQPESSLYRLAMLLALAGMPFFLRLLDLDNRAAAGYALPRREAWQALGRGLLIGGAIMLVLTGAQWLLELRHFDVAPHKANLGYFIRTLISGLLSGLAVGLIEETFFRGLMHSGMRRSLGFWPTALSTSALYAALHFMKPAELGDAAFTPGNALQSVAQGLARVGDLTPIADSLLTLLVAGLFLSMVRERTGNIVWAIGIHAGWVMIIKLINYLTDPTLVDGQASAWLGRYDYITGWMATLWLAAIAALYWTRTRPAPDRTPG